MYMVARFGTQTHCWAIHFFINPFLHKKAKNYTNLYDSYQYIVEVNIIYRNSTKKLFYKWLFTDFISPAFSNKLVWKHWNHFFFNIFIYL